MYLKTVELNGFKSFYSHTEITLGQGIIGIVGPNGCGKSNIYDAVQWVLGEQSAKQLRSDEISDVIARGNVRRAEKKQAEAYLTFENCQDVLDTDRDQIEVGRKVDMDGEGTYFLNGETVRLKDVQDLFRDTGIGQDMYSSIGQGEVLKLIESKPEDRREIIEEAAGIASYRHRRDLTRRRLKQTRDELKQVEKDLNEKRGRLSQLRGQAEKAEQVSDLQSTLRNYRLRLARMDYKSVNNKLSDLEEGIEEKRSTLETDENSRSDIIARKEILENNQQSVQEDIESLEALAGPIRAEIQGIRERRSELKTRVESLIDQRERELKNQAQLQRQYHSELDALVRTYEEAYTSTIEERINQSKIEFLRNREQNLLDKKQRLEKRIQTLRERSLFKQTEAQDIKRRLEEVRGKMDDLRSSAEETRERLGTLRAQEMKARSTVESTRESLLKTRVEASRFAVKSQWKEREKDVLTDVRDHLRTQRNDLKGELKRLKKRRKSLKKRIESTDGVPSGAKPLLNGHGNGELEAVLGLMSDHVDVDSEYGEALEAVLGERLHDVLVDSKQSLASLWNFVKQSGEGPVRIRPVDPAIRRDSLDETLPDSPAIIGPAKDHVHTNGNVNGLLEHLLQDVVLVSDIGDLLEDYDPGGDENGHRTYVDLNGSMLEPDGTLAVDEVGRQNGAGVFKQKRELASLEERYREAKQEVSIVEEQLDAVESLLQRASRELKQIEGSLQGLRGERRDAKESLRQADHDQDRSRRNIVDTLDEQSETRRKLLTKKHHVRAAENSYRLIQQTKDGRGNESEKLQQRVDSLEKSLETLRKKQRSVEQRRSVSESRLQEARSRRTEREDRLEYLLENIREADNHAEKLTHDQLAARRDLSRQTLMFRWRTDQKSTIDTLKEQLTKRKQTVGSKLESINEELRNHEKSIEQLRGQIKRLKSERSNERERKEELVEKIRDDLEIEPAGEILELELDEEKELSRQELSEEVRRLKSEVRELQPVNMLAREEADELEGEVNEVQSQYEDLQASCDELESLIERLNRKARKQFLEAFSEIQSYFEDFVADLFQGGRGSLELSDDPVLESGVKIEIEPPGEQLRTMSALSGGEKTLGALAFLFALYERKSTPFCFLDEIDHPLDDENVNQFIQLLSRYRERTQFIIITHNKLTMQAADKLFGVTMEESGVTSIVPMNLKDAESLREPQEVG